MLSLAQTAGPGGLFPTLPDSAPGYAYPVVGATLVLLALIYYAAKRAPRRDDTPPAPAPVPAVTAPADQGGQNEVDSSFEVLHDVIERLSKAQTELAGCRAHAERSEARNRRLIEDLKRTQVALRSARRDLDRYARQTAPAPSLSRDRPELRPIVVAPPPPPYALTLNPPPDENPTDPIFGQP